VSSRQDCAEICMTRSRQMGGTGRGQAMAGLVTGYITLGIIVVTTAFWIIALLGAAASSGGTPSLRQRPASPISRTRAGIEVRTRTRAVEKVANALLASHRRAPPRLT
jgi:hypothetical protein